ncbi:MAG TPA: rhodanese-like domain-containing protein [Chitinophagaceae bacterium]|nr:rhodanese-like domain-containing protein [Chitinophagaceae bacterium]
MGILSIFGSGEIKEALKKGAVVIDVRTAQEYDNGRVPGSVNIPVDRIATSVERIKGMNKPIVFCCASGIRSRTAKSIMQKHGMKNVYAAGSWEKVLKIMNKL